MRSPSPLKPTAVAGSRFVEVVNEDGLFVWRLLGSRPRRVLVFDRDQYREEILTKVRQAYHRGWRVHWTCYVIETH